MTRPVSILEQVWSSSDFQAMALSQSHRIIWLDAFIGKADECHELKRRYCTSIEPNARNGDNIDVCIYALNENAAPFIFVDSNEQAIEQIVLHQDKQIVFISSGTLAKGIIPKISANYPYVYSFNIFCALTENYIDLALEYANVLKIFIHEADLLVRLVRDLSSELINQGRGFLYMLDPTTALEYFQRAKILEQTANQQDTLNIPFLDHLRLLDGYQNDIGLIQRAREMLVEQAEDYRTVHPLMLQRESHAEEQNAMVQDTDLPPGEAESQESQ